MLIVMFIFYIMSDKYTWNNMSLKIRGWSKIWGEFAI